MTIDVVPAIEPAEPGAGRVRLAALGLVTVSKIVPPLRVRAARAGVVELGTVLSGGDGVGEG